MLENGSVRHRVIRAALNLAESRPWKEIRLRDVARTASVDLAEIRREFRSKTAIVAAFMRAVDDEVAKRTRQSAQDQAPRDRIFDVVMTRFDVLSPYKPAVKSIMRSAPCSCELMRRGLASQAWMLHAAGIATEGPVGAMRTAGLASVYASTLRTWLDHDDEPDHGHTMAALDRRLKRGEELLGLAAAPFRLAERIACAFVPGRGAGGKATKPGPSPAAPSPQPEI